jgi:glycerol-3-phosphate dehydrogenase (NAD(P)+)
MSESVAILGDGQMALVMADALAYRGLAVRIWGPVAADALELARTRRSPRLDGFQLPESVQVTAEDRAAFDGAGMIISAIPTQYLRSVWQRLRRQVPPRACIISVTKGIEIGTSMRPTQVIADVLATVQTSKRPNVQTGDASRAVSARCAPGGQDVPNPPLVALSGPSIAAELARRLPASLVAASADAGCARLAQDLLHVPWLRVYRHDDVIGVEMAGATKNVIALAAGMIDGLQAGDNAKSALLARGLAEIARLGVALGAKLDTFFGIAGVGDLATTCFSPVGRNRTCGERLARGEPLDSILSSMSSVVEGVPTTRAVLAMARAHHVDMPITAAVHAILFEGLTPREAIRDLMGRELKAEQVG